MSGGVPGSVEDLMERAAAHLPAPVAAYLAVGSGAGITAAEATPAWDALRFAPRVLRSVTDVELRDADGLLPFGIAPATLQRAVHPDGELATARGAAEAGARMVVSSNTGTPFRAIAETGVTWWLQTYLPPDRPSAEPLLQRAVEAGAAAVVLTADTPVVARKRDAVAARVWGEIDPAFVGAEHPRTPLEVPERGEGTDRYREKATDLGPHDIGWLAAVTGLPVVVKGVLRADDAQRCIDAGAAAVWVSNHGGRQFDGALPTARALPGVVASAAGQVPVYVDGGLREPRHLCGAWGLGAAQVFLARPVLAALALGGAAGVRDLLLGLAEELVEACRLLGATTPADLAGTVVDSEHHRGDSSGLDR